jgi:DNA polymerase III delta prime subunit
MLLVVQGAVNRGKDLVSDELQKTDINIQSFARVRGSDPSRAKVVVIYDFDNLLPDTQMALRGVIEQYQSRVRFILLCQDLDQVIEAIQSRCTPVSIPRYTAEELTGYITRILRQEEAEVAPEVLQVIIRQARGSLRQALNLSQTLVHLGQVTSLDQARALFDLDGYQHVTDLIRHCQAGETQRALQLAETLIYPGGYHSEELVFILLQVLNHEAWPKPIQTAALAALGSQIITLNTSNTNWSLYLLVIQLLKVLPRVAKACPTAL